MESLLGQVQGLVIFIACVIAYTLGIKHGKALNNGKVPEVNINPVKPIIQHIEHKQDIKQQKQEAGAWESLFNYDGFPQKQRGDE